MRLLAMFCSHNSLPTNHANQREYDATNVSSKFNSRVVDEVPSPIDSMCLRDS